jgi:hypothetical protein
MGNTVTLIRTIRSSLIRLLAQLDMSCAFLSFRAPGLALQGWLSRSLTRGYLGNSEAELGIIHPVASSKQYASRPSTTSLAHDVLHRISVDIPSHFLEAQ